MFIYLIIIFVCSSKVEFIIIIMIMIIFLYTFLIPFFFYLFACLALVNSLLFGYDHNEWVLFHFLSNKFGFKSTLYLSWKSIEVYCETDSRTEFAISVASLGFSFLMNSWNKLPFAIRKFVITSGPFWDGLIFKSQKQAFITITNLLLMRTKRN